VPVIALCFLMGLYPAPFMARIEPSVDLILARLKPATAVAHVEAPEARP